MPLLKEFDFDLPYQKNELYILDIKKKLGLDDAAAIKSDYEMNWKIKRDTFRLQTRCITALYERFFEKYHTVDFWKILIECVPRPSGKILNFSGVLCVQISADLDEFFLSESQIKKRLVFDYLCKGLQIIIEDYQLSELAFNKAKNEVIASAFLNEWSFKKSLTSPNKKWTAEIFCQHEVEQFIINLIVRDRKNQMIIQKESKKVAPDDFFFKPLLGKLLWKTSKDVVLLNKKNVEVLNISVKT